MSFSENLKSIRKERNLSQEDLAEILDVSRQAVSKWELGDGYPEVEKLLLLSRKLNVSLDYLMSTENIKPSSDKNKDVGLITITSPNENVILSCHKVLSSMKMHGGKLSPQYALFGVSNKRSYFWGGEATTFLGWYANKEDISKEIKELHDAIVEGVSVYTLKYSVKTKRGLSGIKIDEE